MKNFSKEDKKWIEKCKKYPSKYKIYVDNDMIFVEDVFTEESIYTFEYFDYDFIVQVLNYIGCNAEWV
ncbi:MAG: hypothetical protein KH135_00715 [Firmicutes bacterium]|nr:hypothetical protein [Bacillota bacterium]